MNYNAWKTAFPDAARVLEERVITASEPDLSVNPNASESAVSQDIRFSVAAQGAMSWRNNVGATPAKIECTCPRCSFRFYSKQQPVRYGLANDSEQMNSVIKSGDLILAIPRVITPAMVGSTIAQFGSIEAKPRNWKFTGKGREAGQANWAALINKIGGFARFANGPIKL